MPEKVEPPDVARQRLAEWLESQTSRDPRRRSKTYRAAFFHLYRNRTEDGQSIQSTVDAEEVPFELEEADRLARAEKIAERFVRAAEQTAEESDGTRVCSFQVNAYRKGPDSPDAKAVGSHPFRVQAPPRLGVGAAGSDEGPDAVGLVSQAQRHAEFFAHFGAKRGDRGTDLLYKMVEGLQDDNALLRRSNQELMELNRSLLDGTVERNLKLRSGMLKLDRDEELTRELMALAKSAAPALISKFAGVQIAAPGSPDAPGATLKRWLNDNGSVVAGALGALPANKRQELVALLGQFMSATPSGARPLPSRVDVTATAAGVNGKADS